LFRNKYNINKLNKKYPDIKFNFSVVRTVIGYRTPVTDGRNTPSKSPPVGETLTSLMDEFKSPLYRGGLGGALFVSLYYEHHLQLLPGIR